MENAFIILIPPWRSKHIQPSKENTQRTKRFLLSTGGYLIKENEGKNWRLETEEDIDSNYKDRSILQLSKHWQDFDPSLKGDYLQQFSFSIRKITGMICTDHKKQYLITCLLARPMQENIDGDREDQYITEHIDCHLDNDEFIEKYSSIYDELLDNKKEPFNHVYDSGL